MADKEVEFFVCARSLGRGEQGERTELGASDV